MRLAIAIFLALVWPCRAELIAFQFTGTITDWNTRTYEGGMPLPEVPDGTIFTGTLVYDNAGIFAAGAYAVGAVITVNFEGHSIWAEASRMRVEDSTTDSVGFSFGGLSAALSSLFAGEAFERRWGDGSIGLVFNDTTGTALSSTDIVTSFNIADWTSATLHMDGVSGLDMRFGFTGEIQSISRVPETGNTALLLAGALLCIGVLRRKIARLNP